jgi:hypothetical protein
MLEAPQHVGFVNSVVADSRGILRRWPPAFGPRLGIAAEQRERFERVRVRWPMISRRLWVAVDGEGSPRRCLASRPADASATDVSAFRRRGYSAARGCRSRPSRRRAEQASPALTPATRSAGHAPGSATIPPANPRRLNLRALRLLSAESESLTLFTRPLEVTGVALWSVNGLFIGVAALPWRGILYRIKRS